MKITSNSIFLLPIVMTSMASAALIVDFSTAGPDGTDQNAMGYVFQSEEVLGGTTGVSFTVTATAVIPAGGGANSANSGNIFRQNGGLGSTVENTGGFMNVIANVSEVLRFTVSGVTGLAAGETLQLKSLLSQNSRSLNGAQTGGYGGTFGQVAADSVTLTSDNTATVVINQSDTGNLGSILLNADGNNATNTGNTFEHLGTLDFTNSFDVAITGTVNNAVVIQGFEFVVVPVPEPSTSFMALGSLGLLLRRRR